MHNAKLTKNVTAFLKHLRIYSFYLPFPLPSSSYLLLDILHCHVRQPLIFQRKRLDLSLTKLLFQYLAYKLCY